MSDKKKLPVDIPYFRQLLLNDKGFLYSVYRENILANKRKIANVSDSQLTLLIKIIHLIANHVIELDEEQGKLLVKAKKLQVIKKLFLSNADYTKLIQGPREKKIQALMQVVKVLPILMYPLFNL